MKAQREDFRQAAASLAGAVARKPVERWAPGFRLTQRAEWFCTSAGSLITVVGDHERTDDINAVLGFVLGVMGDVTSDLVLPAGKEGPTLRRLRFLTYPIRVWTHMNGAIEEAIVPTRPEVLSFYDDPLVLHDHDIGDSADWITGLIEWADAELDQAHRPSYLSWHYQGRKVLQVQRSGSVLRVVAGTQYKDSANRGLPQPVSVRVDTDLSRLQEERLKVAIGRAIVDRESRFDEANAEHRFQSGLAAAHQRLGYSLMRREVPAKRTGRGFVDFLATTTANLIVVETKRGPDAQLALQGLDYWLWATAHAEDLATALHASPKNPVQIDFVVDGSVRPVVSPYTAAQVEALDGSIPWRFRAVDWEANDDPTVVDLDLRQPPGPGAPEPFDAPRRRPPRYKWAIARHLEEHAPGPLVRRVFLRDPVDGVVPAARHVWDGLKERGLLHKYASHLRSSQTFAVNLFAPLDEDGATKLLRRWFDDAHAAEPPILEWSDPLDRLGETSGAFDHQTQVDVLLRGTGTGGRSVAALIEVKFTEDNYGSCVAYESAPEPHRTVCRQPGPFGGDPAACWSMTNKGTGGRRTYDKLIGGEVPFDGAGCWYRTGGYQPMRNVAQAQALLQSGEVEATVFVVCAPRSRTDLRIGLRRFSSTLHGLTIDWLDAEDVLALHNHPAVDQLALRYQLRLDTA